MKIKPKPRKARGSKFYTFRQNNSGGGFDFDKKDGISTVVIVEATDKFDAIERAEWIGLYFFGTEDGIDCDCCGDRWSHPWEDGTDNPELWGEPVKKIKYGAYPLQHRWQKEGSPEGYVHYMNGAVVGFGTHSV